MNDFYSVDQMGDLAVSGGLSYGFLILFLVPFVLMLVSLWLAFEKAGRPGWAVLVPIYSAVVWFQVAGKSGWWVLLMLIPVVNVVFMILASLGWAKKFGRSSGFGVGLIFLPIIFYPILAFSKDIRYVKE